MSTFIVIPISDVDDFDTKPLEELGNKSYRLPNKEWLVSYNGTSRQLSDELGISNSDNSSAVVFNFSSYWGRAKKDVWEWIEANGES